MTTDPGAVRFERRGTTAVITLDRPSARNAITWAMYEQLDETLDRAARESELRVVVIRGAGGHFAAGTDITQFVEFRSGDDGLAYERRLDAVLAKVESLPAATIAAVQGFALGGGMALAAACDLCIATPDAQFGVPIAKTVGNCLSMANHARLVAAIGASRARALLVTARILSAEAARAIGFVAEVIDRESFDERLDAIGAQVATCAPITLQITREAIRRIVTRSVENGDDLVRRAYDSRDFREGVSAFVEKRPPRWEGR